MDRRQRYPDREEELRTAFDGLLSNLWTALPGIIQSFDPVAMTVAVQPAIKAMAVGTGGLTPINLPLLPHCLVWFPRGGGCSFTFPVARGDECLVVFASRALDGWWQSGAVQPSTDLRTHDLSDGIALVGLTSKARPLSGVSTSSVQLRSDSGATVIDLNPVSEIITLKAPSGLVIDANVTVNGTVTATGDVKAGSISLEQHIHTNSGGSGNSGPAEG